MVHIGFVLRQRGYGGDADQFDQLFKESFFVVFKYLSISFMSVQFIVLFGCYKYRENTAF